MQISDGRFVLINLEIVQIISEFIFFLHPSILALIDKHSKY